MTYVYSLISGKRAVSKEILDLFPEGCKVNWNEKRRRFYVYKSSYRYNKEHKKSCEQRTQVGTIVSGVFTQFQKLSAQTANQGVEAGVQGSTADVANKTSVTLCKEVVDPRQAGKVLYLWPVSIW